MIVLAYDGSVNGDWVAGYAAWMAAHEAGRLLKIVHVKTGEVGADALERKLRRIGETCRALNVDLHLEVVERKTDTAAAIADRVPADGEAVLLCGARMQGSRRGYLAGTVSERLLWRPGLRVLAIRSVKPGLLGEPHEVLWALGGRTEDVRHGLPFVGLLAPGIRHLRLLRVMTVGRLEFRRLQPARIDRLRALGEGFLDHVAEEVGDGTALESPRVSSEVRVSDSLEREVMISARRHNAQLVLVGAQGRRFMDRLFTARPLERLMRDAPCDIAVYRGAD